MLLEILHSDGEVFMDRSIDKNRNHRCGWGRVSMVSIRNRLTVRSWQRLVSTVEMWFILTTRTVLYLVQKDMTYIDIVNGQYTGNTPRSLYAHACIIPQSIVHITLKQFLAWLGFQLPSQIICVQITRVYALRLISQTGKRVQRWLL